MFRLLIVISLVIELVYCSGNIDRLLYRRNSVTKFEPIHGHEYGIQKFYSHIVVHNTVEEEMCSTKQFAESFKVNFNKIKCQPKDAVIHLVSSHSNFTMTPSMVMVKRCHDSGCFGAKSCAPKTTREIKMPIHITTSKGLKCVWIRLVEHTSCRCDCLITRAHCHAQQEYVPSECRCRCKNFEAQEACGREGRVWNDNTCSCECDTDWMECSTGSEWVPRMCKCMRIMMDEQYTRYMLIP